jgi:hypothetical protein
LEAGAVTLDLTRRSLLKFMGGAVAGAVLSPLPWKLLDDASIWTQNWSRIARPPRGPVSWRDTTCTLCPAGCGLRARLVGASYVSAWPQPGHPAAAGACPLGLAAAQMRFHPARVRGACRRDAARSDAPWEMQDAGAAVGDVGRLLAASRSRGDAAAVAILDLRPGRALSRQYREFLQRQGGGMYLVAPDAWQASAAAFTSLTGTALLAPAPAPARARSILCFGTPLADAAHSLGLPAGDARPFHIQVDATATATAARADRWLPVRPGSEAPLALALAHVLVHEALASDPRVIALAKVDGAGEGTFAELLADFAPERVAETCGLPAAAIRDTARELAARRPALVLGVGDPGAGPLGAEEEAAVWCLNLLLGEPGPASALRLRPADEAQFASDVDAADLPRPQPLAGVPDGSLDLLIVDGSFPGAPLAPEMLRRKLRGPEARMVALSPYAGGAVGLAADLVLPTPAPGEWLDDVPTPAVSPHGTYAWSPVVAAAPDWAVHPAEWLARIEAASGLAVPAVNGREAHEAELARRAAGLQSRGAGGMFDPQRSGSVALTSLVDPDAVADMLKRGGTWIGDADASLAGPALVLPGSRSGLASRWRALRNGRGDETRDANRPLLLVAGGGLAVAAGAVASPVLNKLYRESELLPGSRRAALNPRTAKELGLADGASGDLGTGHGARSVIIRHDRSLPPGVVSLATGPDPLDLGDPAGSGVSVPELCGASQGTVWRLCGASLKEVRHAHA